MEGYDGCFQKEYFSGSAPSGAKMDGCVQEIWLDCAAVAGNYRIYPLWYGTEKLNHMEEELQQMVQGHLEAALSAYDGIDMRSANVEGVILPTMQEHLCYAQALDNAITNMFGAENEMFPAEVHQIFLNAMDEYRRAAKTGQSADRGRDTLDTFAEELRNTMTRHFDARGDLVQE